MPQNTEIEALVKLLDDEDPEVFTHVEQKIISFGETILPTLENAWSENQSPLLHERLEDIIHQIQFKLLLKEVDEWLESPEMSLTKGYFLITKYFYPELIFAEIQKRVQKLKQTVWLELNYNQTPLEQVGILNKVFFDFFHFQGLFPMQSHHDFCLNNLLDTKKGSAISVGILYQILAQELSLPIYGVRMFQYYICCFTLTDNLDFENKTGLLEEVSFYINPSNNGVIFSEKEIKDYLKKVQGPEDIKNFVPASNKEIILELIMYLTELSNQGNTPISSKKLAELKDKIEGN